MNKQMLLLPANRSYKYILGLLHTVVDESTLPDTVDNPLHSEAAGPLTLV